MYKEKCKIYDEVNGISYVKNGDYYVPEMKLPEEKRSIGKYERLHREYLENSNPILFNNLVPTCRLWTYLSADLLCNKGQRASDFGNVFTG